MKITKQDSIGLTIRFSWRELGFLRKASEDYRASKFPERKSWTRDPRVMGFCLSFLKKVELLLDDENNPLKDGE